MLSTMKNPVNMSMIRVPPLAASTFFSATKGRSVSTSTTGKH